MGTSCLIRCVVVLLLADDQRSSFMTNGHLPPVGGHVCPSSAARLSFVCGSLRSLYPDTLGVPSPILGGLPPTEDLSFLRPRFSMLAVSQ